MQLSYDPRYNIAYIRFQSKSTTVESIKVSEELIIDIAPDGRVYGIELLNANEQISFFAHLFSRGSYEYQSSRL